MDNHSYLNPNHGVNSMKRTSPLTALLVATALCAATLPASAQSTWTGGAANDDWFDAGNWSGGVPNAIQASVLFDNTGVLPATIDIGSDITLGDISLQSETRDVVWGGAGIITINDGSGSNNILNSVPNPAVGSFTINNDMILTDAAGDLLNVNNRMTISLNGNLSGVMGVRKTGAGLLNLTGTNSYNGITRIDGGIVRINNGSALGAGDLVYNGSGGSTKNLEVTANTTIDNDIVINYTNGVSRIRAAGGVTATMTTNSITNAGGSNELELLRSGGAGVAQVNFTGDNLSTSVDIDINNALDTMGIGGATGTQTWSGIISGNGSLVKSGDSTVTLSGDNTYAGTTTVEGGTLLVEGTTSGLGEVTVEAGGTLGGSGAVATASENVTVLGTLAPGSSIGTLTMDLGTGTLDISSAAGFEFELGATGDMIALTTGTLDIGTDVLGFSDFTFLTEAGFDEGDYTLFDTDASIIGSLDLADLTGNIGGFIGTLSLINGGQDVSLNVAIPEPTSAAMLMGALGLLALRRRRA